MENDIWIFFKSSEIELNVLNLFIFIFLSFEDIECGLW